LDNPKIATVLVGMKDQVQLEENLKAVDWQLDQTDREMLMKLSAACPRGLAGTPAHEAASC
jgi:aryl-alcohol dehydrogenase-like predicted oxidoreductase